MTAYSRRWRGWAAILVVLPVLVAVGAEKKRPPPPPPIDKLAWLAGSWRTEMSGGRVADEQWMVPGGGVMLGAARTVLKGRVVTQEFLQIRGGPGGALFFVTRPSGENESLFQVTSLSEAAVAFANPAYDFPRTIRYELKPDGTLVAVREGLESDGQAKRTETSYQRLQP